MKKGVKIKRVVKFAPEVTHPTLHTVYYLVGDGPWQEGKLTYYAKDELDAISILLEQNPEYVLTP